MANSVDPDQTAPIGAVCSWSMLFASMLNSSVMLSNYLQQTTSADDIFRCVFFLAGLLILLKTCFLMIMSDWIHHLQVHRLASILCLMLIITIILRDRVIISCNISLYNVL